MIPGPLYKSLPYVYVTAGILTLFKLPTTLGAASGTLLIAAGVLVILWRSQARSKRHRTERIHEAHAQRKSMHGLY